MTMQEGARQPLMLLITNSVHFTDCEESRKFKLKTFYSMQSLKHQRLKSRVIITVDGYKPHSFRHGLFLALHMTS